MKNLSLTLYSLLLFLTHINLTSLNAKTYSEASRRAESASLDYSKMSQSELNEAFVLAVQRNYPEVVELIIKAGADINTPISYEYHISRDWEEKVTGTALDYAVEYGYSDIVKVLLATGKITKEHINTSLYRAIERGRSGVVQELIKGGGDPNCIAYDKKTVFMAAVSCSNRTIIQTLLKAGANLNHVDEYGRTALMIAVEKTDINTVKAILQTGEMSKGSYFGFGTKPINYANKDGNTALILAVQGIRYKYYDNSGYNHCMNTQEIVKILSETPGINPHHVNKKGDTAISLLEKVEREHDREVNPYHYNSDGTKKDYYR